MTCVMLEGLHGAVQAEGVRTRDIRLLEPRWGFVLGRNIQEVAGFPWSCESLDAQSGEGAGLSRRVPGQLQLWGDGRALVPGTAPEFIFAIFHTAGLPAASL